MPSAYSEPPSNFETVLLIRLAKSGFKSGLLLIYLKAVHKGDKTGCQYRIEGIPQPQAIP